MSVVPIPPAPGPIDQWIGVGCVQRIRWPNMFAFMFFLTFQSLVVTMGNEKESRLIN